MAEILLQQTRVATAVPAFERWMRRFPRLADVASASEDEVLKLWEGLGYYARARNLLRAARWVGFRRRGRLPHTVEEWETLPGIGPYTARAIACLSGAAPVLPVDGNVVRVASRWFGLRWDARRPRARVEAGRRLLPLVPAERCAEFAEGLMELGERICTPRRPRCPACPARSFCAAVRLPSGPEPFPGPVRRTPKPQVRAAVVLLLRRGRILLCRRTGQRLLGGLWELPGGKLRPGETPRAAARRELREETGLQAGPLQRLGTVRHSFSHFDLELHAFRSSARQMGRSRKGFRSEQRWVRPEEMGRFALPTATRRVLELMNARPNPA